MAALALGVVSASAATAETEPTGSISGTVTIPDGAPEEWLESVGVHVWSPAGDAGGNAQVESDGSYLIEDLPDGEYRVEFAVDGFWNPQDAEYVNLLPEYYPGTWFWEDAGLVSVAGGAVAGISAELEEGRTISGTVELDSDSEPSLASQPIYVQAELASSDYWYPRGAGLTIAEGQYEITGLVPGEYLVRFFGQDDINGDYTNVVPQYFENVYAAHEATLVDLTGQNANNISAVLTEGYSISGKVALPSGVPNEWINAVNATAKLVDGYTTHHAYVSPDGTYEIAGLRRGEYEVFFEVGSYQDENYETVTTGLLSEYYDDVRFSKEATLVSIVGESIQGIDAELEQGRSISGKVTLAAGSDPNLLVQGITVSALPVGDDSEYMYGESATVDPYTGQYNIIGLEPGTYEVVFEGATQWFDYAPEIITNVVTKSIAEVDVTEQDVTGVNAELVEGGTISGTVTVPSELPTEWVKSIEVSVLSDDHEHRAYASVGVGGTYTIVGLPEGEYEVFFGAYEYYDEAYEQVTTNLLSQYYPQSRTTAGAVLVSVDYNHVRDIDADIQLGRTVSGSVSIRDDVDSALLAQGIVATIETTDDSFWERSEVQVDPDTGEYLFAGLYPDEYVVSFEGLYSYDSGGASTTNVLKQYYLSGQRPEDATPVDVTVGDQVLNHVELTKGAILSGTVSIEEGSDQGLLAQGITVSVESDDFSYYAQTQADPVTGEYTVSGLPEGDYRLLFTGAWIDENTRVNVVSEYFEDASTFDDATLVEVSGDTSGIDAVLEEGRSISGTVSVSNSEDQTALSTVRVQARDFELGHSFGWTYVDPSTGDYTISGLPAGSFLLYFEAEGNYDDEAGQWVPGELESEYYDNVALYSDATPVVVGTENVTGIDAALSRMEDGELPTQQSLTVEIASPPSGLPYGGSFCVTLDYLSTGHQFGPGSECVASAADLPVTFTGIPSGSLEVSVFQTTGGPVTKQRLGGTNLPGTGEIVEITEGSNQTVELQVQATGSISGVANYQDASKSVGDESVEVLVYTERVPGDWVQLDCSECGGAFATFANAFSSVSGAFGVSGLVPGQYKVGFRASYDNHPYLDDDPSAPTVFHGGKDLQSAAVVSVTANGSVTGINAVLPLMDGSGETPAPEPDPTPGPKPDPKPDPKPAPKPSPKPDPKPAPAPKPAPVNLVDVSSSKNSKNYTQFNTQIQWLANTGITKGWNVGGGKHEFRPKDEITREAMAAFMYRYAGSPAVKLPSKSPFSDVTPQNTNFYKEIIWMNQQGISTGWSVAGGKKEFRPKDNITRDAMAAFMYRFAGKPKTTAPATSPFVDVSKSSQFYKEVTWLSNAGISTGWTQSKGKPQYRPYDEISREAMAAFLYRLDRL